jgi:ABC-type uncharacterized transport system ATPase subunit
MGQFSIGVLDPPTIQLQVIINQTITLFVTSYQTSGENLVTLHQYSTPTLLGED